MGAQTSRAAGTGGLEGSMRLILRRNRYALWDRRREDVKIGDAESGTRS